MNALDVNCSLYRSRVGRGRWMCRGRGRGRGRGQRAEGSCGTFTRHHIPHKRNARCAPRRASLAVWQPGWCKRKSRLRFRFQAGVPNAWPARGEFHSITGTFSLLTQFSASRLAALRRGHSGRNERGTYLEFLTPHVMTANHSCYCISLNATRNKLNLNQLVSLQAQDRHAKQVRVLECKKCTKSASKSTDAPLTVRDSRHSHALNFDPCPRC